MRKIELPVTGMTCAACAGAVEKAIDKPNLRLMIDDGQLSGDLLGQEEIIVVEKGGA